MLRRYRGLGWGWIQMLDLKSVVLTWTDERVDLLRQWWTAGDSARVIAKKLDCGVSRSAVIGKAYRLKLEGRNHKCLSAEERKARHNARARAYNIAHPRPPQFKRVKYEPRPITHQDALDFLHKQLLDLTATDCRYPDGEGPYTFCGQHTERGTSWCRHHLRIVERHP